MTAEVTNNESAKGHVCLVTHLDLFPEFDQYQFQCAAWNVMLSEWLEADYSLYCTNVQMCTNENNKQADEIA